MTRLDNMSRSVLRFEKISQRVWPLLRPVFGKEIAKRCKQCVISDKVPGITLTNGICNRCHTFNTTSRASEEVKWEEHYVKHQRTELDKLLKAYQGRGKRRWDALVLFSGGKDSTYMIFRIKKEYPGLRMLAMTWDNGFYSQIALNTAAQGAKRLDVDYVLFKPAASVYKNLYRHTLMQVNESGSYGTVDRFDGTLNQHLGLRYAAELEIPLMISGVDWAQALLMGSNTYFEHPPEDLLTKIDTDRMERRSRLKIDEIFTEADRKLYWDGNDWPVERIPRFILPFVAWRPDKEKVAEELESQGLILPGHSSPLVTNNQVLSIMSAVDIKKIGYCSFEPEFSDMIRLKRTNATYWKNVFECLEFLVHRNWFMDKSFMELLAKLDLTLADIGLDK